ncbi:acetylornithine deacetylase/succinyl-diaminopimelate desuccinylase-like protein [Nonomuraea muscovyensis]|uniref:Acetylornithine deacetylase/succinyl-diaminopimelate desuccinylase-like protein n=1 Tax=Nonomuraea muscovyensis TaxID=1124761 RepID=A0A7X0C4H0_9ACTN|nr:M20/M25/M40 family metallo-hydrolase [Nonomuraea muscovyensis]MBB6347491.1 acetylornithine deacetylase/succinyl-diaminopimelate desuccinylase-like protein [Nonomuraea muscovyensis]
MTNRVAEVEAWLDERAEDMAWLLERLVAVDSENPPGRALGRCARVLREEMDRLGLSPEIIDVTGDPGELEEPCVVRGSAGRGDKLVYFHGHFDVVPAQDRAQFTAERRGGRIIGRGTADMKGGIVSMLYGAAAARELGLLGDGRIVVHLVCDEETGSVVGAGHLRAAGLIDPAALAMLTAEPSGGGIWNAARGAISLRVDVQGREAHVGQANLGVNAFQHMLHLARPVERYAAEMAGRHTGLPMSPGDAPGTMIVVGGLSGAGSNFNVVPGSAYFTVDGRYNPEEDLDGELKRLVGLVEDAARQVGAEVSVRTTQVQPSAGTDPGHPAAAALARVVGEVRGGPARFELCAGILEIRWYAQLGIPAFGYGPGRLEVSHGPEEYVEEAELRRCAAVYALYAGDMLS